MYQTYLDQHPVRYETEEVPDIGDHCVGAKVNNEPVALRTALRSGDVVEVVCMPGARPNPAWLNFVHTGRARSRIRHYLKTMEQEESERLGEKMLEQALRGEGYALPVAGADDALAAGTWQQLIRWSGNRSRADLLTDIGLGKKIATIVAKRLARLMSERGARPDPLLLTMSRYATDDVSPAQALVLVDGGGDASMQLAPCCRPIPGDPIVGYLGRGEGLVVHTVECGVGRRLFERDNERWIGVDWAEEPLRAFETGVTVLLRPSKGALAQMAQAVSAAEADIKRIEMGPEPAGDAVEMLLLTVSVRDRLHLAEVMRALKRSTAVARASRVRP